MLIFEGLQGFFGGYIFIMKTMSRVENLMLQIIR